MVSLQIVVHEICGFGFVALPHGCPRIWIEAFQRDSAVAYRSSIRNVAGVHSWKTENPGPYEQHMVILDRMVIDTCDGLPSNFNRYLLRAAELQPIRTKQSAFIFVKMCRVMIFGFIQEPEMRWWKGTRLRVRNGQIGGTNIVLPSPVLGYLKSRAELVGKIEKTISSRQREKIRVDMEKKLERVLGSESLQAKLYDYDMFGPDQ